MDYSHIYHHGYLLCSLWLHKKNEKGENISFHRFQHSKPDLLQKWVQAVRRQNWYPKKNSLICSVHITESCFTVTPGNQCHQLHENAIPSVFPQFPKHLRKTESKGKSSVRRKFVESKTSTFEPSLSKMKKSVNTEHAYISNKTPDAKIKKLTKKIDALHQKVYRWEKQIKNMKDFLDTLKQKQPIANNQHVVLNHNFGLGGGLGT